jgi:hypothetical protein
MITQLYLIKRICSDYTKSKSVYYNYGSIDDAISTTKNTCETIFNYNHVAESSIFEIWADDSKLVTITTNLVDFCPDTMVTFH